MATTSYGTPYVEAADLVSGYPGTSLSLADRVDDISFKGNGINNQTGTTYTLDILDAGKTVTLSNSSAVTVTIPTNTAEAIEIGSIIRFNNKGAGTVTIQPDGGVTLNGGNISLAQNAAAQIVKLDTNTWGAIDSLGSAPGLNLISPTSIANSGGTASASGGAVTFSGVNSVSVNGCFSSTYDHYKITLALTAASATSPNIHFRMRASGTDASGANTYGHSAIFKNFAAATVNGTQENFNQNRGLLWTYGTGIPAVMFDLAVNYPALAQVTSVHIAGFSPNNSDYYYQTGAAVHNVSTAYDGITFYPASGTFTGTIRVYGYRN